MHALGCSLQEARERCAKSVGEVERRFPKGVPLLDPEDDMRIEVRLLYRHMCTARHAAICTALLVLRVAPLALLRL